MTRLNGSDFKQRFLGEGTHQGSTSISCLVKRTLDLPSLFRRRWRETLEVQTYTQTELERQEVPLEKNWQLD